LSLSILQKGFDFGAILCVFWYGLIAGEAGVVLEPPDQRDRGLLVHFVLTLCSLVHTYKVFGEMPVRN
jgi:hypothetical protein